MEVIICNSTSSDEYLHSLCVCSCKHKYHYTCAIYHTAWIFGKGKVSYLFAFFIAHIITSFAGYRYAACMCVCIYYINYMSVKWGWMNYILTWVYKRLVELMHRYHKCKSIWENLLNGKELTFNHCTIVVVICISKEGISKVMGHLDLTNYNLKTSEYVETTSRLIFQIATYVTKYC